jgi:hypothetical protein
MTETLQTFSIGDYIVERNKGAWAPDDSDDTTPTIEDIPQGLRALPETQGQGPWVSYNHRRPEGIEWETVTATHKPTAPGKEKLTQKLKRGAASGHKFATATVGGVCHVTGGWGEYEAARRAAEREMHGVYGGGGGNLKTYYAGRVAIGGKDVAESLLTSRPPRALQKAAEHLSKSLGNLEDTLCDPDDGGLWTCEGLSQLSQQKKPFVSFVIPSLISEDVDSFVADGDYTSPDDLYMIADAAASIAANLGVPMGPMPILKGRDVPPLPARMVSTDDSSAVAKLEAASVPYVSRVEELQAAVASLFDKVADIIDKKVSAEKQ